MRVFIDKLLTILAKVPLFRLLVPVYIGLIILFIVLIKNGSMQLLEPAGIIADAQSRILWGAIIFAAIIAAIMIGAFFWVTVHYRDGAPERYIPNWHAGHKLMLVSWGVPLAAITVISVMVWVTIHALDPSYAISSKQRPITIQVIAERWKWLFVYPNDHLAAVNELQIPVGVPITFQLTADAPMASFWVPRLGGQIYAMTGMTTTLHLRADQPGTYAGTSAEISGGDFAGMEFTVKAVSMDQYNQWKEKAGSSSKELDDHAYTQLAKPSSYVAPVLYHLSDTDLFQTVVMKYMEPATQPSSQPKKESMPESMPGMKM